ncbi:MAG: M23 family metallopeptidase [Candidatus Marinimicrobia bacterium]|nr:M23 family metallopeptidase [Candidatus Neomarinimicrobiota bacterium]
MKKTNYTVHIVSDDSEKHFSFQIKEHLAKIGAALLLFLIFLTIIAELVFIPRALKYSELKKENEQLIQAKLKISKIINDYNQIVQMDSYIREVLGADINVNAESAVLDTQALGKDTLRISYLDNLPVFAPVEGYVTQKFKRAKFFARDNHYGLDIAAEEGEPIKASASGIIIFNGWTPRYGYMIIISHSDGYFTVYSHNQKNMVETHQHVERGEVIGFVGNTGVSDGPHLHYEIWKDGKPIDPLNLVYEYKDVDISNE